MTNKRTIKPPKRAKRVPGEPAKICASTKMRYDLFIAAYVAKGHTWSNGKASAIAAGYSEKTASAIACNLLRVPYIQEKLKAKMESKQEKFNLTADSVMQQLAAIVQFDIRKLYNPDGTLKNVDELDDDTAAAVSGIDVYLDKEKTDTGMKVVGETRKFKAFDKIQAIDRAMRHFGLLKDGGVSINAGKVIISQDDADLA